MNDSKREEVNQMAECPFPDPGPPYPNACTPYWHPELAQHQQAHTATTTVQHTKVVPAAPKLAATGFESGLLMVGIVLVAIGGALRKLTRLYAR